MMSPTIKRMRHTGSSKRKRSEVGFAGSESFRESTPVKVRILSERTTNTPQILDVSLIPSSVKRKRSCTCSGAEQCELEGRENSNCPRQTPVIADCPKACRSESSPIVFKRRRLDQQPEESDSTSSQLPSVPTTRDHHRKRMAPTPESEDLMYNSFNYWRPVLPDIEDEIGDFLSEKMDVSYLETSLSTYGQEEEDPEFNSFNYWRDPLPVVDIDFDLTL